MAIGTSDVITPVLAAAEVVPLFFAGMAIKTSFRDLLRGLVLEGDDLCLIAATLHVRLTRAVARFAAGDLVFPTGHLREIRMGRVRVRLELIFVAVLAHVGADVIGIGRDRLVISSSATGRLRASRGRQPDGDGQKRRENEQHLD